MTTIEKIKALKLFGIGVAMMAFGAAGLNSAHAGEMRKLNAGELRQVQGAGNSPLAILAGVGIIAPR